MIAGLQDGTTQPWRDPFHPPVPEKVQMGFSEYTDVPGDPGFERQKVTARDTSF